MKAILAALVAVALAGTAACGPRQVNVETGPQPATTTSLTVTNNSTSSVNVYVESGGAEIFVGEVAANSTQTLPVQGVADGSVVTLRARPAGGTGGWSRANVTLSGNTTWRVP